MKRKRKRKLIAIGLTVEQQWELEPLFRDLKKCQTVIAQVYNDGAVLTVLSLKDTKLVQAVLGVADRKPFSFDERLSECQ